MAVRYDLKGDAHTKYQHLRCTDALKGGEKFASYSRMKIRANVRGEMYREYFEISNSIFRNCNRSTDYTKTVV